MAIKTPDLITQAKRFDENTLRKFLQFLNHKIPFKYQVFKPNINGKPQGSGRCIFVGDINEFIKFSKQDNGTGMVCVGINELRNTNDITGITKLQALVFDIDANKKTKFVSSIKDHNYAISLAKTRARERLERLGFKVGCIVDSGNGAHIYIKVNIPLKRVKSREEWFSTDVYKKLAVIEKKMQKLNDGIVHIDCLTKDPVRRMKVPGTLNYKDTQEAEHRMCRIVCLLDDPAEKENTKAFYRINPAESDSTFENADVKSLTKEQIRNMFRQDKKMKDLYFGDWQKYGYRSRSEAEIALISKMVHYHFSNKNIYELMDNCKIGKWQDEIISNNYKRRTIASARNFIKAAEYNQ